MTTSRILLLTASLAACAIADGAVVELNNGDRISGRVVSRDAQVLHFKSDVFGRLDIPLSNVAKIQEDKLKGSADVVKLPPVVSIGASQLATAPKVGTKPGEAKNAAKPDAAKSPKEAVAAVPPVRFDPMKPRESRRYISHMLVSFLHRINYLDKWKSNLRIGYSLYSGETDSFSSTVNFLTERLWKKSEARFEFMQDYATSTDTAGVETVSRDKLKFTGRYRYNINNRRMFFQTEGQYGYSHVSGIDQDYLQSVGYGWRLIQTEIWYFCLVPAVAGQYQVIEGDQQGLSLSPTLYEEAEYKWTDTLRIHNESYALIPVNGDNNPTYHFSIMLQNKLSRNLSLNIEYLFDFDGSVKQDKDAASQSLRASFGIDF
jgi:hypothetical protein